jgi:hypothetical protein
MDQFFSVLSRRGVPKHVFLAISYHLSALPLVLASLWTGYLGIDFGRHWDEPTTGR